ncbi:DUF6735 family protein [Natronobacterium texcoconense]|uniref:Uncharacterized protein n=1 Tax=Natronobacterium texcoconense TaxID=1095778 RepID=A0A1H1H3H3_NATTX|nr:DUF6735 family protein [Natronobacterium texcoconense]SDR20055.1 hypothetical protein SAMN04489842_2776 [Natronobacterium texcoconense]
MGHRALVAYRRPDHLYDLRYSHWGGDDLALVDGIDAQTPLADGRVDGDLLADSIARERILSDHLDPRTYEALYLVAPGEEYVVDAYQVCWLEWGDGRDGSRGAIVAVEHEDDRAVRIWFRATKTVLGDAIEMGALSRRAAQAYLEARVREDRDGTIYTYGTDEYEPPPDCWPDDDPENGVQ